MGKLVRNLFAVTCCVAALMAGSVVSAGATGQPGAPTNTCGPDNPVTPGNSATSPGSPFNPNVVKFYAGNTGSASLAHSNSANAVSQYDVACVRLSH